MSGLDCRTDAGHLSARVERVIRSMARLEAVNLDGLGIKLQTFLLVDQEFLHILALVTLQLDHLAHLRVVDDGAIASELLLDHLEDLLLVKLLGESLDRSQGLAAIALLDTDMNVVLRLLALSCIFIGFGEGVEGLEVFDLGGHKTQSCAVRLLCGCVMWFRDGMGFKEA